MNFRPVFHLVSFVLMMVTVAMLLCLGLSALMGDAGRALSGMTWACLLSGGVSGLLWMLTRGPIDLSRKDGFGIAVFGWLSACYIGCLPYIFSGIIPHPVDAFFETMSGFTTTGASVLRAIDDLPKGILLWRSLTQWLGGMGVLLLCVAILPFLGVGGMQIYRAEMPGPSKDRLTPRIASTAKLLWGVYVLLTLAETLLLRLGGLTWFDAVCHSFCTLSTGGFSTHLDSASAFPGHYVQIVFIVFMFLGGINFSLHFRAMRGEVAGYFKSPECRLYVFITLAVGLVLSLDNWKTFYAGLDDALIAGFFQASSILTTTGFANADFDRWSALSKITLFLAMFLGGCAGSTTGGIKIIRLYVVVKELFRQIRLFMQPQAVIKVKAGKQSIDPAIVGSISAMVIAFVLIAALGTYVMTFYTPNLETAVTATLASLGNIGPGYSAVGPTMNYADVPYTGKALLSFLMLMGRLELFTVLVVLNPRFWRK